MSDVESREEAENPDAHRARDSDDAASCHIKDSEVCFIGKVVRQARSRRRQSVARRTGEEGIMGHPK